MPASPIRISAAGVEDGLSDPAQATDVEILSGTMAGKREIDLYSTSTSGNSLNGLNRKIYDLLKSDVERVAREGGSTTFQYSLSELGLDSLSWTADELRTCTKINISEVT